MSQELVSGDLEPLVLNSCFSTLSALGAGAVKSSYEESLGTGGMFAMRWIFWVQTLPIGLVFSWEERRIGLSALRMQTAMNSLLTFMTSCGAFNLMGHSAVS